MGATELDQRTALVLIDLQRGIVEVPTTPTPAVEVVANGVRLAQAFRAKGLPVVLVRVSWSADGGDRPGTRVETPMPTGQLPDWADLVPELHPRPADIVITKRQWGAFHATELDLQLRRRQITGLVIGGISTSLGVESTARAAYEHGYNVTIAADAISDHDQHAHHNSLNRIFPKLAQIDTTKQILALLD